MFTIALYPARKLPNVESAWVKLWKACLKKSSKSQFSSWQVTYNWKKSDYLFINQSVFVLDLWQLKSGDLI